MSRLDEAFRNAKRAHRAAFVPYITAGDPTLARTVEIARSLAHSGADVLELGVPFSDPIADGPTNQRAAERALASGTSLAGVLAVVEVLRGELEIAIVLFSYANPVLRYGLDRFACDAAAAGVDGVLFTDVPVEEAVPFAGALARNDLDLITLVTPTSTKERVKAAAKIGGGFLYLVSRTGVTGARDELDPELASRVRLARRVSRMPVAVGFGISTVDQVRQVADLADGVVVGSAIVDRIEATGDAEDLAAQVGAFAAPLAAACAR